MGIPLAGGMGLSAADGTSAIPLAVLGFFLALHGYFVYSGVSKVAPARWLGFLYRPDLDLSALWCGAGLVAWGLGWMLSIPPFLPVDIVGQVIAWAGAALFLFGIATYIHLPLYLRLPNRLRPAWLREAAASAPPPGQHEDQDEGESDAKRGPTKEPENQPQA